MCEFFSRVLAQQRSITYYVLLSKFKGKDFEMEVLAHMANGEAFSELGVFMINFKL